MDAFLVILGLLSIAILGSALFIALRWRMEFTARINEGQFHLIPDHLIRQNLKGFKSLEEALENIDQTRVALVNDLTSLNGELIRPVIASNAEIKADHERNYQALQAVLSVTKALREETQILREEIQRQADELDRHRKGYDTEILARSLVPVARIHNQIRKELDRTQPDNPIYDFLVALEDEHFEVLETNGVRTIFPETGALYRDQKNIKHPPATITPSDSNLSGTIAEVIDPAYEMTLSGDNLTLLEATVVIYAQNETAQVTEAGT